MNRGDNGPRPYSTLVDGKIIWVYPNEARPGTPTQKLRSRRENDAEVRARIKASGHTPFGLAGATGTTLDSFLILYGLAPRELVDEVV